MDRQQDVLRWFNMEKLIEKVLKKEYKYKKKNFNSNFSKELIDSIQFLEFISHIEKKFKVKFSNKDMSNQKFFSINGIIASLDKKLNANKKNLKEAIKKSDLKRGDLVFCHSDLSVMKDINFSHSLLPSLLYKYIIKK